MGCDAPTYEQLTAYRRFQSTHPSWGATAEQARAMQDLRISIHAPLVGCDIYAGKTDMIESISIHAPLVGCDELSLVVVPLNPISIHAPLVGCDAPGHRICQWTMDFNPRTPRGVRRRRLMRRVKKSDFNPRTPRGVRLTCSGGTRGDLRFQSTHPSWGATTGDALVNAITQFQSTHPSWGATPGARSTRCVTRYFNPRTPRGVRRGRIYRPARLGLFQSTHPSWGATRCHEFRRQRKGISIHAPLVVNANIKVSHLGLKRS